jgi:hypothetical protein
LDRQPGGQRFAVDGRSLGEFDLHVDLYGRRWQLGPIRDRLGDGACTNGEFKRGSERYRQRRQFHTDLVIDQCNRVYRFRGLVGQRASSWVAIDGGPEVQRDLYADLQRHRRQRLAIGNGRRKIGRAIGQSGRQPKYDRKRRCFDAEVDNRQCIYLYGLGRLVRQQSNERFAVLDGPHGQLDLYLKLHWWRRQRVAVSDSYIHRIATHCHPERESRHG